MYSIRRVLKHAWIALLLVPSLANAQLSNSQEPGSLIVFPYFKAGTVNVSGQDLAKTEIHVGVKCPTAPAVPCMENTPVKLEGHWVCPGSENPSTSFVCRETNFVLFTTINGKITLNPNGQSATPTGGYVPAAPCPQGYLIVFVVNMSEQPIKFDGLIGDAVVRLSDGALSAYSGVPVQAAPALAQGELIPLVPDPHTGQMTLAFDGTHYTELTGQLSGDVKFDNTTVSPLYNNTFLILLTLDVQSNFPNNPTFVPVTFYNAKQAPTSTEPNFVCWQKVDITKLNASLNQTSQGSAEGSFVSGQATKVAIDGISDFAGSATLLGLVLTTEGSKPNGVAREYITAPFNNSMPVSTFFALD
jgi:hypothetical protein